MTEEWRESLIHNGQHPYAVVVTCSDARVQPAIIFSMHLGDLFVIRTVGGYIDRVGEASVEYGVGHLAAPLVVVLGQDVYKRQPPTGSMCERCRRTSRLRGRPSRWPTKSCSSVSPR